MSEGKFTLVLAGTHDQAVRWADSRDIADTEWRYAQWPQDIMGLIPKHWQYVIVGTFYSSQPHSVRVVAELEARGIKQVEL